MLYRGRDKKEFYLASLLYDSIEFRHFESVKSLLTEKGADPNIILPKKGISPFHLVVGCDSYEFALKVTSLILQNGGSPNIRSDDGLTPIHIAAAWGRTEILKILLSNGGDPEVRDISYKTPFHYAIEGSFVECLNLLRSYLPEKNELLQKDECDECNLVLDKVLVNNGFVIGEYDVVHENKDSIIQKQDHLHSLPKTDTTEYILNWFNKQYSNESSNITENVAKSFGSSTSPICSDSSLGESDADKEAKRFDSKYITFRKVYKKTRSKSSSKSSTKSKGLHENAIYLDSKNDTKQMFVDTISTTGSKDFTKFEGCSKESGIVTLPSSLKDVGTFNIDDQHSSQKYLTMQEKSSDYLTCSHNSISTFEKNVFEITDDLNSLNLKAKSDDLPIVCVTHEKATSVRSELEKINDGTEMSFVSVSEVYKYVDKEQGIILYEKRLLKTPSEYARSVKSSVPSSRLSSLPETFDYDTDTLRKELTMLGFNPGPITITTKKVYLRKLHQLKKHPALVMGIEQDAGKKVYSLELEKTLRNYDLCNNAVAFKSLEEVLAQQFSNPDPSRKWREGVIKSSFTYLLLDPRITNNLPYRVDNLQPLETWRTFLSAIFYVGKGKRSRPYQHLYDAVELWKNGQFTTTNKKLQTIIDIWKSECGVICLHVFLNIIPVEAYTREAAMISAIKLENLTNIKPGEFYGVPATWPQRQKRMLGVYLLHKAMMIFLNEGERQLCPRDID